jgi:hypothetical protein
MAKEISIHIYIDDLSLFVLHFSGLVGRSRLTMVRKMENEKGEMSVRIVD